MRKIKTGSDFSGVGAFDQALKRLEIDQDKKFACDMDKHARDTYILNYGEPEYYPENVYDRSIPEKPLDIYMTSPPCQAFSLAGKRKGKDDLRGILFFNSLEFIEKNRPRYFIFENVKGLLSHNKKDKSAKFGQTFNEWINFLGGKSVNGNETIFPYSDSVPYHIYFKVINSKLHGVPQNRERVFILGIRDDEDNDFNFPRPIHLKKNLRDVLEENVSEKYYLSEDDLSALLKEFDNESDLSNNPLGVALVKMRRTEEAKVKRSKSIKTKSGDTGSFADRKPVLIHQNYSDTILANPNFEKEGLIALNISNTLAGFEVMTENDSLNLSIPNSKTRRGRVGKNVAQTLDTQYNQAVIQLNPSKESREVQPYQPNRIYAEFGVSPTLNTECRRWSILNGIRVRRLTPRECFRLMDFPDSFIWNVSDNQAYKQAGNSIVVECLVQIIKRLKL